MAALTKWTLAPMALLVGVAACASLPTEKHWAPVKTVKTEGDPAVSGADGYYAAAVSAITRRDYGLALDMLQEADARKPGDVRVNNAFGVVYDKLGRFDLSARYYAKAQAADAQSVVVAGNIAYSAELQGRALAAATALTPLAVQEAHAPAPKPNLPAPVNSRLATVDPAHGFQAPPNVVSPPEPSVRIAALGAVPPTNTVRLTPIATRVAPPPTPKTSLPGLAAVRLAVVDLVRGFQSAPVVEPPAAAPPPIRYAVEPAATRPVASLAGARPIPAAAAAPIILAAASPVVVRLDGVADTRLPRRLPLLAGRGLEIADASGQRGAGEPVRLELARHGWSVQPLHSAVATAHTAIFYPPAKLAIARGLARTLPFEAKLAACVNCQAVRLTIGRDSLSWASHARSPKSRKL